MMVNEFKNNALPWQSTVPQQMPWMSTYEPNSYNMVQFGGGQPSVPTTSSTATTIASTLPATSTVNPIDYSQLLTQQQLHSMSATTYHNTPTTSTLPFVSFADNTFYQPNQPICNVNTTQAQILTPPPTTVPSFLASSNNIQPAQVSNAQMTLSPNQQVNFLACSVPSSLTQMPPPSASDKLSSPPPQKRRSIEMESEDLVNEVDEPPTKQLLSERKLFKKFGSLHLEHLNNKSDSSDDSDDSVDAEAASGCSNTIDYSQSGKDDLNRYVYILFKDKKDQNSSSFGGRSNTTLDRLAREERDKLSKAVILWNPPSRNHYTVEDDDDDDESFHYKDHKDFLKKNQHANDDSIVITDVTHELENDSNTQAGTPTTNLNSLDDAMMD